MLPDSLLDRGVAGCADLGDGVFNGYDQLEEALAKVVDNVDEVKMGLNDGTLTIDFTDGQLEALVMMLKDYTERLAAANGMELADPPAMEAGDGVSNVILLRHYLGEQQRILQAA